MGVGERADIIGAGIGGLSCAIALAQAGFEVTVHEQAPAIGDVGAGITLGPNASRVLIALGLGEALAEHGNTPQHAGVMHFETGEVLSQQERGARYLEQFGAPFWHIHRADLLEVLAGAAQASGRVRIHCGRRLADIGLAGDAARLRFADGSSLDSPLLIACDGIKSTVRARLFGDTPAVLTGYVAWRGLVPREALPGYREAPDFALYVAPGALFGRYTVRGRRLVNYVAIGAQAHWREEGWMVPARVEDVLAEFAGWCEPVREIIAATPAERCFQWALHVREPLDEWVRGPVVLAGDAAHPMTPFLGLGAGIAIEDAMVLSRALSAASDLGDALARYQRARVAHANRAQRESAAQGLHLLAPPAGGARRELYGENALGLYHYDATTVPV